MASEEDHNVYAEEDLDDDDDDESEDDDVLEDDDDDDDTSSSPFAAQVTIAVPGVPKPTPTHGSTGSLPPDPTRQHIEDARIAAASAVVEEKKPLALLDDSRKLFQRLWTDEDEIELLQGFLDYSTQRGLGANSSHHHHDTAAFYDQIKSKLQLEFNKNQLVEKLRRLKKKYRNVLSKIESGKEFVFKSSHDQATFDISKKIWSNDAVRGGGGGGGGLDEEESNLNRNPSPNLNLISFANENNNGVNTNSMGKKEPRPRKRARGVKIEEKLEFSTQPVRLSTPVAAPATSIPNLIEETVRSCLSPLFKELLQSAANGGSRGFGGVAAAALSPMPLSFGGLNLSGVGGDVATDERWRKQQMLELEVYSKRLELVQDQIKSALEELRAMGS